MRQRKHDGAQRHHEDSTADPASPVVLVAVVADDDDGDHRRDVVTTHDDADVSTPQVVARLDRRDYAARVARHEHGLDQDDRRYARQIRDRLRASLQRLGIARTTAALFCVVFWSACLVRCVDSDLHLADVKVVIASIDLGGGVVRFGRTVLAVAGQYDTVHTNVVHRRPLTWPVASTKYAATSHGHGHAVVFYQSNTS